MIEVRYFGPLAEIAGLPAETFEATRSDALLGAITARYPALAQQRFALAVGHRIVSEPTELVAGDIVSLLPPFSGG